jgi:hypothetical protein
MTAKDKKAGKGIEINNLPKTKDITFSGGNNQHASTTVKCTLDWSRVDADAIVDYAMKSVVIAAQKRLRDMTPANVKALKGNVSYDVAGLFERTVRRAPTVEEVAERLRAADGQLSEADALMLAKHALGIG